MNDYEIVADSPDLLVIAQKRTRNRLYAAFPVGVGVMSSLLLIFNFLVQPWIAILIPATVVTAVLLTGFWLFQGTNVVKIDKATRVVTTMTRRWLPPFERIEYFIPFSRILHAGVYPYADAQERRNMLGMETKEGIIKLIPKLAKTEEHLLAKIVAIANHLATVDPKLSQQGREPGHVVTVVEFAPANMFTGTARGSVGFNDVRQDLVNRVDQLLTTLLIGGDTRGEGRVPTGQDMLEALRTAERKIIALDLKVSGFASRAHAALFHAFIAHEMGGGEHVPRMLRRARYNLLRA